MLRGQERSRMSYQQTHQTPPPPPKKKHGCFFYGCITSIVLVLIVAIGLFFTLRFAYDKFNEFTQSSPMTLPKAELPPGELAATQSQVRAFSQAVEAKKSGAALVLNEKQVNALIGSDPKLQKLRETFYFSIQGDQVKGQVSFPLERLGMPGFKGRYLNGEATFKVTLNDGVLIVTMESLKVGSKELPTEVMDAVRQQNWAQELYKDAKAAEAIRKLGSIIVKDGNLIITGRGLAGQQ